MRRHFGPFYQSVLELLASPAFRIVMLLTLPRVVCLCVFSATAAIASASAPVVDDAYFETHVRPLLVEHCYECHSQSAGETSGELRLDTAAAIQRGGLSGAALVPNNPDASLLIKAINYDDPDLQMPPAGKLNDDQIARLKTWIAGGAPDPRKDDAPTGESVSSPLDRAIDSHWAFVPPKRIDTQAWMAIPEVKTDPSHGNDLDPIDEIARRHAATAGLTPSAPVDTAILQRRLSHALHGLPASETDITSLQTDARPDAAIRRTDRMLADPLFAERFTRHWLDVARYADTLGYAVGGKDRNLKHAYRYRDWLINAIAADMPYNEMIHHQLAGDITSKVNPQNADAMGFLTVGRQFLRHEDTIDDQIDVITRGLLGLTVTCARCHDHKFDPIPTIDYYSMFNVLDNSIPPPDMDAAASPLLLVDRPQIHDVHVFIRGDRGRRGELAPRRYLTAFRTPDISEFSNGSGRLELAQAITDSTNPLTARVMVNRVWDHLLGRPLVDSASDFGFRTEAPALQAVLDDLAADFAEHWSIKRLVRRIVNTRIFRQSVQSSEQASIIDPDNTLWTHGLRRRLDFESMRDSWLVGCGYLDHRIGGPSVEITESELTPRRTLYARIDRQNLPGLFRTFDFASPDMHSPGRYFTTVPQQPLFLLNHPQMADAAQRAIEKTQLDRAHNDEKAADSIDALFRQILGRAATPNELADAIEFVRKPASENPLALDPRDAWQYGTATFADDRLTDFTPLTVFKENRWQFEETFPSPGPMSYASLSRDGGHPAHGDNGAIVRRWTSPCDGELTLSGTIVRPSDQSDGITATIQVQGKTLLNETVATGSHLYDSMTTPIHRGDHVDLIVHSRADLSFDSFRWQARAQIVIGQTTINVSSTDEFSGPHATTDVATLDRLEQLAQVLFLSNEFLFVD
jgi:hypothetical protein